MKLYIPEIGDRLKLTQDWEFLLFIEHRNQKLCEVFKLSPPPGTNWWGWGASRPTAPVKLPAGTVLKVDRIYIRKGKGEFSSLTFYAEHPTLLGKKKFRFWAKLIDVNSIECELLA